MFVIELEKKVIWKICLALGCRAILLIEAWTDCGQVNGCLLAAEMVFWTDEYVKAVRVGC